MSGPRAAALAAACVLAVLVQVSVVTRIPWPGGGGPDLVVGLVIGAALGAGPRAGALCGFGAGLLLDIAPPADHAAGQWAFVLCALGYAAGLLARDLRSSWALPVALAAAAAAAAPIAFAALGAALGDPRADLAAAAGRMPVVALWTLLLAPAVVLAARRLAGPGSRSGPSARSLDVLPI